MIPSNRIPEHPGELLLEEFLRPMEMTQSALAEHIGVPVQRINEIVNGRRDVNAEMAWMLGKAFKMSPEFWMNAQAAYDLAVARQRGKGGDGIKPIKRAS